MLNKKLNIIQEGTLFKIPVDKTNSNILNLEVKENNLKQSNNKNINIYSSLNLKYAKIKNDLEIDDLMDRIIGTQEKLKIFVNKNSEIIETLTNYHELKKKNKLLRKIKNFLIKLKISKELVNYILKEIQKYEIDKSSIDLFEINKSINQLIVEKKKTKKKLIDLFDKVIEYSKQIGFID